jgi:23S rRNA (adenine-N6)-dimethyltransferase
MNSYHNKSSLSQNFIKFPGLIIELLESSDINSADQVVEIGPGKGIITLELSKKAKDVIAVEKDRNLVTELHVKFKDIKNVKIIGEDFLNFNLPSTPYKVFSNIPFSITSEIISKLVKSRNQPESMYFIMQQEAAEKFLGYPVETQSSVLVKPWYQVKILGNIDRTNFTKKPQVKIVFIEFIKRERPFIDTKDMQDFRDFVIYGFSQWRSTVIEAYKKIFSYNQIKIAQKTIKLSDTKPTQTSFDTWQGLYKLYKRFVNDDKKLMVRGFERKNLRKIS